jgi:hypothetical protein
VRLIYRQLSKKEQNVSRDHSAARAASSQWGAEFPEEANWDFALDYLPSAPYSLILCRCIEERRLLSAG